jgi:DNA-binding response OmpR family regulator
MPDSQIPASEITITVVDDNPDQVEIVRLILKKHEFNVKCAYSGPQLLAGMEEQIPDLIILDIMMPQMDGLEVLTMLKGNPATASIPIILLTAKVLYEDVLGGYNKGADYYITKPFTHIQLLTGVNLLLSRDQGYSEEASIKDHTY